MWLGYDSRAFTLATYLHLFPSDLSCGDLLEGDNEVATRLAETSRTAKLEAGCNPAWVSAWLGGADFLERQSATLAVLWRRSCSLGSIST
jgi:hypothetical protein